MRKKWLRFFYVLALLSFLWSGSVQPSLAENLHAAGLPGTIDAERANLVPDIFTVPGEKTDPVVIAVNAVKQGNSIVIEAENLQTAELTITLDAELENLVPDTPLPMTLTIPGKTKVDLVVLSAKDASSGWKYKYKYYYTWGPLDAAHDDSYVYTLPYASGSTYTVTQGFNGSFSHKGDFQYAIDWGLPEGTPVYACREGIVVGVQQCFSGNGTTDYYRNRANYVMIKHPDGTIGEYDHLEKNSVAVEVGQKINVGDFLGYSDNSGFSTAPHLHFMVYKAIDGRSRQSFPIRFRIKGSSEPVTLEEGESYEAP